MTFDDISTLRQMIEILVFGPIYLAVLIAVLAAICWTPVYAMAAAADLLAGAWRSRQWPFVSALHHRMMAELASLPICGRFVKGRVHHAS